MYIIKPIEVDPAVDVTNLTVPMDDVYLAWDSLLQYQRGDIVTTGSGESQKIWEARHAVAPPIDTSSSLPSLYNQGMDPTQTNVVGRTNEGALVPNATEYHYFGEGWWRDATDDKYLANRYRMFDPNPAFYTESDVNISFTIKPTGIWSGVALFNVVADEITVTSGEYSATRTLRYDTILSQEFQNEPQVAFVDLPLIDSSVQTSAELTITLSVSSPRYLRVGYFCIGEVVEVGQASYGLTTELMDFSRYERDVFGNVFTIKRGYSDKITYPYVVKAEDLVQVRQILTARRATLTAYIGHPDVPLTTTYGYFVDLDIPIDKWGQSDASIVVESVLYDTPGSTEDLPKVVEFIDPTLACVEESLGRVYEICLKNGTVEDQAVASILDVVVEPTDVVDWTLTWVVGESEHSGVAGTLATECDQLLPTFTWPETVSVEQLPAIGLIKATITKFDESVINLEPATLIVTDSCSSAGPCTPCYEEPTVDSYGWYDPAYVEPDPPDPEVFAYALTEDTQTVEFEAAQIPAEGLEISGCAGEIKYYWADITCGGGGYGVVSWTLTVGGDNADVLTSYIERNYGDALSIPTEETTLTIAGAGLVLKPAWGTVRVLMRVDFSADCESALLSTARQCGVPMAVGGGTIQAVVFNPAEPTPILSLKSPETEEPVYYVIDEDLQDTEVLDSIQVSVTGDVTAYVGINAVPDPTDPSTYVAVVIENDQVVTLDNLSVTESASIVVLVVGEAEDSIGEIVVTPVIVPQTTLVVHNSGHIQIANSLDLVLLSSTDVTLVNNNASHIQSADNLHLTLLHPTTILTIDSANHLQTIDDVALEIYTSSTLENVSSCLHGQFATSLSIEAYDLGADSTSHQQIAQNITLAQSHSLVVDSSEHYQTSSAVVIGDSDTDASGKIYLSLRRSLPGTTLTLGVGPTD